MAKKKPKSKVKLPCDRIGTPINIGDVLEWDDGSRLHVTVLEWYGDGFWVGTDADSADESDNLQAGIIVGRIG